MPIRPDLPPEPDFGAPLDPAHPSPETLRLLALRRSTPVSALTEPGPSAEDLDAILRLGMRVPDHRKLEPWRVLIIESDARIKLGEIFAAAHSLRILLVVSIMPFAFQWLDVHGSDPSERVVQVVH